MSLSIPEELPTVIRDFTREAIRFGPKDERSLIEFSRLYFTHLADGNLDEFLAKETDNIQLGGSLSWEQKNKKRTSLEQLRLEKKEMASASPQRKPIEFGRVPSFSPSEETPDVGVRKEAIYKAAFDRYDKDGNGTMDSAELKDLLTELGWRHSDIREKQILAVLDKDNNGTIDLDEFLKWTEYSWKHAHSFRKGVESGTINDPSLRDFAREKRNERHRRSLEESKDMLENLCEEQDENDE